MAIFMAVATYAPNYAFRLPLIGYVKIWHLAVLYVFIDVSQLLTENTGGHIAHLSGSIVGFTFCYVNEKRN